ncbi:hypothetical protein VPH35_056703 [Triticum aestivum]
MAALLPMMYASLFLPASVAVASHDPEGSWAHPGATLEGCPTSCGNLSVDYPFGIGSRCSRGPDFNLTCNDTTKPPTLFLSDGISEVLDDLAVSYQDDGNLHLDRIFSTSFRHTILMKPGVHVYDWSFKPPGRSFEYIGQTALNITGCDLDVYWVNDNAGTTTRACRTVCPDQGITETVARHHCNGTGCCSFNVGGLDNGAFHLTFVQGHKKINNGAGSKSNRTAPLWDRISITDDGGVMILWQIVDQPNCVAAMRDRTAYACVSKHSDCYDVEGYICVCNPGYSGNPFIKEGCSKDKDINECLQPNICKANCHNIEGSFYCTECPRGTEYDLDKMQCTTTKQQILLSGKTKLNHGLLLETLISSDESANDKAKIFSLQELEKATDNFDRARIIGSGGHGTVYKGILSDQRVVAIKRPKVIEQAGITQFINEVAILSQINHRNIVKLFGCCLETEVPLLVYEHMSGGSLSQFLHADSSNSFSLSWDDYLRIAMETAGALSYLHSAASMSIFHRDVKSSNILLDGKYTAKVSDFGASRLVPINQTHIVTNVQGTFGYLDPEYFHTRQLNEKSDVYSFGVVLVELLVRMKPIITSESGTMQNLSNYFLRELSEGGIADILNSQVLEEATEEEIINVATLAERCLRLHGEERPTMKQVEVELQTLRTTRASSCQDPSNEEQTQPTLLTQGAEVDFQSSATELGCRVNLESSQGCYDLQQEFMESASLAR